MKKSIFIIVSFFSLFSYSQEDLQRLQSYMDANLASLGITAQDGSDWIVESETYSTTTKIRNYYLKQRHQGIELFHGQSNFSIKDGEVFHVGNRFEANISQRINATTPVYSAFQALELAYAHFSIEAVESFYIEETIRQNYFKINNAIHLDESVLAKLVYQLNEDNMLRLAWDFTFYTPNYKNLWSIRIDAINGNVLEAIDLTRNCSFGEASNHSKHNHFAGFTKPISHTVESTSSLEAMSGAYRVYPYYVESPNHGARELLSSPFNTTASPFGWHDTNGVPGPDFTITRGNNVWAKEDIAGINSNGSAPNGGTTLLFDYPYGGNNTQPSTYTNAAITNLFYMTNIMHDVWYNYGFDEQSGNFQQNNYGYGAAQNDYVLADAQDGSGINNANFSAPVDGIRGRVQMFLWDVGPPTLALNVNSPTAIAGTYAIRDNNFNPGNVPLPTAPNGITSNLVLYVDGTPDTSDACSAAVNAQAIAGKICVIRRGTCLFVEKVKNAQNAGAIAVIIVNNVDGNIVMGGADATITIPAISVTQAVGEAIIAQMAQGIVNATLQNPLDVFINSDGSFDNGIIAHEYGHGISIRLAGGRNNSSCLNNAEQMGEGWSDWFALMMQLKSGDVGTAARGIGTYAVNQPTNGNGIRSFPYSVNTSINPMTFNYTNTEAIPHGVGSVWATMLWDLTWAYIAKYGFDSNIYSGFGGNNKVMQLVIDGLKIQPCNPSFVDARNALIAADQATTGGEDFCMIWNVFANRGLGVNASSGLANNASDQVEDFTTPPAGPNCTTLTVGSNEDKKTINLFPNPTTGIVTLSNSDFNFSKLTIQVFDLNGRKVYNESIYNFSGEKSINLSHLLTGVYLIKVNSDQMQQSFKLMKN
ncbi:T9SS-dependent M36 family metallopeptidase [Flavobacterium orientale]|uniref:Peptidase M36 n=1 Tax=Flavobacterium orientale TaxID=1756020 RepID=A0A916Y852_9FLAO|nr:T9SS-dependent M36 family metallopeptidase [Flavobacterium orientale]GGD34230.1 peptidase M36 [Flavobacterium orientale]